MNIKISTEQLSRDIRTLRTNLEALNEAEKKMYACLENLSGMWEGASHNAFFMQTTKDRLVLSGLEKNLTNLVECMEYANSQYEKCHQDVNQKISGIRLSGDT